jgi:taurine dioxygenase
MNLPMSRPARVPGASPPTFRTLVARRYEAAIGAEIDGVDLTRPLGAAQRDEIIAALVEHQVIFFHGPPLDNAQLAAFARIFGEPQPASESSFGKLADFPEIDVLAYGGGVVPYVTKELWHTDFSGRETPTMGSVLHCLEAPSHGGDTIWISMFAAYDALSDRMKQYLAGMKAEHRTIKAFGDDIRSNLWKDEAGRKRFEQLKALPPAEHPVVRTHPVSGRKGLFINEGYTTRLLGVDRKESDAVLNFLFAHVQTPEFQCRYRWKAGDVAVWDNRSTQHYAVADYPERRVMHRITLKGDKPY